MLIGLAYSGGMYDDLWQSTVVSRCALKNSQNGRFTAMLSEMACLRYSKAANGGTARR